MLETLQFRKSSLHKKIRKPHRKGSLTFKEKTWLNGGELDCMVCKASREQKIRNLGV